jgi:hypothetical protein
MSMGEKLGERDDDDATAEFQDGIHLLGAF